MEASGLSHLVVSSVPNLLYLTGRRVDTGERLAVLLLSGQSKRPKLYIHEIFANVVEGLDGVECVVWSDHEDPVELLADSIRETHGPRKVGIDTTLMSGFLLELQRQCPDIQTVQSQVVEQMREVKDDHEIDLLRRSSRIADAVIHEVVQLQRFPASELQMAEVVRHLFEQHQVSQLAFPPIIGFGSHSANPHHVPAERWARPNQVALVDVGGVYQHYCSDITRMVYFGDRNKRLEEVYQVLRDVHEDALSRIKPGVTFAALDTFIRTTLARSGYDQYFIHRTGHGLGLEAHEQPSIHQNNHHEMQERMVVTVEPGIYFPGEFGIRIEDVVVVTPSGCEVLTLSPREIQYVDALAS